jgi:hypothetical protein
LELHPHFCGKLKFGEELCQVNGTHLKIPVMGTPIVFIILNITQRVVSPLIVHRKSSVNTGLY